MPVYQTQTRKLLLDYLQSHADESLSAGKISEDLPQISVSAVYRNLAALERDGAVCAVSRTGSRERLYRFAAAEQCKSHLHLSCTKCGRTFHMNTEQTEDLVQTVAAQDRFMVDRSETVLYGICEACQKKTHA